MGKIYSINISKTKGTPKTPIESVNLIENFGLEGDVHGQQGIKQVSLLAIESINKQNACPKVKNNGQPLKAGDFAENITTEGIELINLKVGDNLTVGTEVILEISKIGKDCHKYCAIYYKTGDCIMPREGIFAKVIKDGNIRRGEEIDI
ncbi:MAG: MOSC domain-containing protein [Candidatus Omnitrophota bacterium]|nr:MOSC domain-containing protein [Candidatus Omnitrophota bacterium]